MKHISFITLLIGLGLLLTVTQPVSAQLSLPEPEFIESVVLELWPDFDRPSMLVIETVILPQGSTLPSVVRLPLPAGADINAVAFQEASQQLITIPDYEVDQGQITLITPARTVRLEYYLPMTGEGDMRAMSYSWTAFYDVGRLEISVQEPLYSSDFNVTPAIEELIVTNDGLRYHQLPNRTVATGESIVVNFDYTLPGGQLTTAAAASLPTTTGEAAAPAENDFWSNLQGNQIWVWTAAALLLVAAVFIGLGLRDRARAGERPRKPQRQRPGGSFCPNCGAPHNAGDQFCRSCGKGLK